MKTNERVSERFSEPVQCTLELGRKRYKEGDIKTERERGGAGQYTEIHTQVYRTYTGKQTVYPHRFGNVFRTRLRIHNAQFERQRTNE